MSVRRGVSKREGREGYLYLKLGDLSDAYEEYSLCLPEGHDALLMLLERFDEVSVDAEEDALLRMQAVSLPSDAEAKLRETMLDWRSPEERPGGGQIFMQAKRLIDRLRLEHEQVLIARLPIVNSSEAYAAMQAEVEREFVGSRTILRGQVRAGRNRHKALLETEIQTMYGWPPTGPGPSLKRAGRMYVWELGAEHPLVEDFLSAARRHIKEKEKRCEKEMTGLEAEILHFRSLVDADPPPPKLMGDSYREKMNEKCLEAMEHLEHWKLEIGEDSPVYLRLMRSTLAKGKFLDWCEEQAAAECAEIRRLGPRPPPSLEENFVTEARAVAATKLAHLLECMEADGRSVEAAALKAEFASDLKRAEEPVAIFRDKVEEDYDDEGWHRPPGFDAVDAPLKVEPPRPPTPPKEIKLERGLPGMHDAENISMRLHGVDFKDVHRHGELLLLEMCADCIAEECGIPRDCIFNLSFSEIQKLAVDAAPPEGVGEVPAVPAA